jgi:hypothetical protein
MNHHEEVPDFLGGLGDMLPADVLKKVNELLELLHQKNHIRQGSKIEIVYVASGGQHVENQIIFGAHPGPPQGREKGGQSLTESIKEDMPLSALFRDNHHEELRKVIESWRPYLIHDNTNIEALELVRFEFDKDRIYSNKVYRDLCELDVHGALQVSLSQLARYLASHSNLSRSYASLYQQLKYYRSEWS